MAINFVLGFLAGLAVVLWSATAVVINNTGGTAVRWAYIGVAIPVTIASYWMTFSYAYSPNENTRVCGWPIPIVVFQRDNADARWLDFVGPTVILGLPMNLVFFMFVPALAFLCIAHVRRGRKKKQLPI
jgi:hypothetical protein